MKKAISIILAAFCLLTVFAIPCSAEKKTADIDVYFRSDIAGLTENDTDRLVSINSDSLVFSDNPILIADYTGACYLDKVKPGRTYYIYYTFVAAEGYELPDNISKDTVPFAGDDNCSVIAVYEVQGGNRTEGYYRAVTFYVKVVSDSNAIVRFFGMISDWILKLKSWSLY